MEAKLSSPLYSALIKLLSGAPPPCACHCGLTCCLLSLCVCLNMGSTVISELMVLPRYSISPRPHVSIHATSSAAFVPVFTFMNVSFTAALFVCSLVLFFFLSFLLVCLWREGKAFWMGLWKMASGFVQGTD